MKKSENREFLKFTQCAHKTLTQRLVKSAKKPKIEISVTWGNDDAASVVKLVRSKWQKICDGERLSVSTWSYYEGERERIYYSFNDPDAGDLQVGGEEMAVYFTGSARASPS